jgi:hypothetical protein
MHILVFKEHVTKCVDLTVTEVIAKKELVSHHFSVRQQTIILDDCSRGTDNEKFLNLLKWQ